MNLNNLTKLLNKKMEVGELYDEINLAFEGDNIDIDIFRIIGNKVYANISGKKQYAIEIEQNENIASLIDFKEVLNGR